MILDENFMDLVWWGLVPLLALYALYVLNDCRRTAGFSAKEKLRWALAIVLLPIAGGVSWFRAKERRRAQQSSLMDRVRSRRGY